MFADTVYIEPLNGETVKKIIEKEIPDAIIGTTGGEAGLEICLELLQNGYLDEHGTKLLGIKPETIKAIRNEQALRDTLENSWANRMYPQRCCRQTRNV